MASNSLVEFRSTDHNIHFQRTIKSACNNDVRRIDLRVRKCFLRLFRMLAQLPHETGVLRQPGAARDALILDMIEYGLHDLFIEDIAPEPHVAFDGFDDGDAIADRDDRDIE